MLKVKAFLGLILFELYLARGNFRALYEKVHRCPKRHGSADADTVKRICGAVDLACIWYFKEVLCLQRSATTVCLLRRHGVHAQMVIGTQQMPFKAHAWVEVDGEVVNDKSYLAEMYAVIDRC